MSGAPPTRNRGLLDAAPEHVIPAEGAVPVFDSAHYVAVMEALRVRVERAEHALRAAQAEVEEGRDLKRQLFAVACGVDPSMLRVAAHDDAYTMAKVVRVVINPTTAEQRIPDYMLHGDRVSRQAIESCARDIAQKIIEAIPQRMNVKANVKVEP